MPNKTQGYSDWIRLGKEKGYYDYCKDMMRITIIDDIKHYILKYSSGIQKGVLNRLLDFLNN